MKELRKALKLTQIQVADRSGGRIDQGRMAKIEGGRNKASSHDVRAGLAQAFGLSLTDLDAYLDGTLSLAEAAGRAASKPDASAKPPAELVVVREPSGPPTHGEIVSAFEEALLALMRADARFTFADSDATRAVFLIGAPLMREGVDLTETVRGWVVAARQLRMEGKPTDPTSVMGRASMGKGALAEQAAAKHDAEIKQYAEERRAKAGYEKPAPLTEAEKAAMRKAAMRPKGDDEPENE